MCLEGVANLPRRSMVEMIGILFFLLLMLLGVYLMGHRVTLMSNNKQ